MASVGDWGELIDEAEAERFVGRERELEIFRQQISLTKPRYLIFYITGQGGAGKSTLLNRYREIAEEIGFLLTVCDEQQRNVPAVLGRFAHQLGDQGFPLKHFDERYKTYRQKMHEIENDPEAPQGLAAMLARTVIRAAYIGSDAVPIVGKVLEFVPRETVETQASEWATYLSKKLTNKEEIALVREPVSILTPLFFEELNKLVQTRKVILCFDNFEAARPELREWLLHLREYKPSLNIRIAIAGRDQPGANWDPLRSVMQPIRIDVFTKHEAASFLDANSITDPKRRKEILELSGRLPVLMSWLAAVEGNEAEASIPTHDIVERFLRWVTEPALRQVALLAAIPRNFNADILKLLLENRGQIVDEQAAFDWLQTMPFVKQSSEGWHYHDVVRRMMLQYERRKSPQKHRQTHAVLANFYNTQRDELSLSEEEQLRNEDWRKYTIAYVYHFLVADSNKHWGEVLSLFVLAIRKRRSLAVEIIELFGSNDLHDELSHEQIDMLELFQEQLHTIIYKNLQVGFEMFDRLCGIAGLSSQAKGYAYAYRGECHRLDGKWEKAQSDFELALQYIPEDVWTIVRRGQTYLLMGHDQEAWADFNRAIALDEKNNWAITNQLALTKEPRNLSFERAMFGWWMATSHPEDYDYGIEHGVTMGDKAICYIKSIVSKPRRPARLTQIFLANEYRGKRLRISSNLKTQAVEQGASLWMNINGLSKTLNVDNMYGRRLWGTSDWQKCKIVLDVPEDSIDIDFGILLEGAGQVWLDEMQFEVVDEDIPTTHWLEHVKQPRNLSFERGMFGWVLAGSHPQDYEHGTDRRVTRSGKVSSYLKARVSKPAGFGTLMQTFLADEYRGKRLRMSGYVKAEGIEQWAGLWMRVDGPDQSSLSFDNMWNRPIQGTSDWQKYEIVLDIPEESIYIAFGILLLGTGQVWLNEINFEVVSKEIPTTGRLSKE